MNQSASSSLLGKLDDAPPWRRGSAEGSSGTPAPSKEVHSVMMLPRLLEGGSTTSKHQRRGWQIMYITFTNIKQLRRPPGTVGPLLNTSRTTATRPQVKSDLQAAQEGVVSQSPLICIKGMPKSSTCYQL